MRISVLSTWWVTPPYGIIQMYHSTIMPRFRKCFPNDWNTTLDIDRQTKRSMQVSMLLIWIEICHHWHCIGSCTYFFRKHCFQIFCFFYYYEQLGHSSLLMDMDNIIKHYYKTANAHILNRKYCGYLQSTWILS